MHPSTTASSTAPHDYIVLPLFFKDGSKATMDTNGVFQKGYIKHQSENNYRFSVLRVHRSPTEIWEVTLHKFEQHWDKLMMDETLFPNHNLFSSLLRSSSSHHPPRASFISACSVVRDCPDSLTAATHADHPERYTWLLSYQE